MTWVLTQTTLLFYDASQSSFYCPNQASSRSLFSGDSQSLRLSLLSSGASHLLPSATPAAHYHFETAQSKAEYLQHFQLVTLSIISSSDRKFLAPYASYGRDPAQLITIATHPTSTAPSLKTF